MTSPGDWRRTMRFGSWQRRLLVFGLAVLFVLAIRGCEQERGDTGVAVDRSSPPITADASQLATGRDRLRRAFEERQSGVWVEADGTVERLLRDDLEGSRHQKFIVDLGGQTVLISHNIDLAPRAPVEPGDRVVFRGRYEWNPQGGVVHWTHHDPRGRGPGGWITVGGQTYR